MNDTNKMDALMRENARLRGDLQTIASRISHDLRTPLGGIITPGEVLKESLLEKDPSLVMFVDSLLESAEEVSRLITRVSFVAKASANPIAKQSIAMTEPVMNAMQRLERLSLKTHAKITSPDLWPEVQGVSSWVEVIWWNLLANALQHGGKSPRIELGWREVSDKFIFTIEDSGSGAAEVRGKLFQPFNTLHQLNSTRGLGLSIVQRLTELQGGECGYEAKASGGAHFFFTLPKK